MVTENAAQIPRIVDLDGHRQLHVGGKPFLILGGELQNSSFTSAEYMRPVWQRLIDSHMNTVLGCVTWELIEPVEGEFEFRELDLIIQDAREHGLHLILLWFGAFKNGKSTYVPRWIKLDSDRFPRAKIFDGSTTKTTEVLSLFSPEACISDARAFEKLMSHIKEIDEAHSTIIMVQVENEVGLLGDSRDRSEAADKAFAQPVPRELIDYLKTNWASLHPDLRSNLAGAEPALFARTTGSERGWSQLFGQSASTEEIFMSYHYALYVNKVAALGRTAYPLPLFTNVWQNYAEGGSSSVSTVAAGGGSPGDYPSGGGTSNVLDIWHRFAPNLDFIAPDIYLNDYHKTCEKYRHSGQPLFIPEQRRDGVGARSSWIAIGSFAAMGISPFGIDTLEAQDNEYAKHYALMASTSALILEAQLRPASSVGFYFPPPQPAGGRDTYQPLVKQWDDYEFTIERAFVFGHPGPAAGMVIHQGGPNLLLLGWGFQVRARSLAIASTFTGIVRFEEKEVVDKVTGVLRTLRSLNGDETRSGQFAIMPNKDPDYGGFPIAVTIPARTGIAEVEFYSLVS
ncbi:hypothetical protein PFICI_04348 [Pestalotiopsis fici W106-1]|uniref:Glycoside hydrolase 35 catalytic domain-containing protein n=1 Tax=Pestalotiopsis fici (strain W106-1 / CGMCC3.15140) TaxID=1229662 RepID=W3XAM3_PESFW|nr:uncharacterized protein PFICI_04348 [Pestalotiopsis fici W106-1]ETS82472.1 hypothetical protein PFICI_04348 [Pestalotiopsis fici W106-1]